VDGDGDVVLVGEREAGVDGGGRGPPVLLRVRVRVRIRVRVRVRARVRVSGPAVLVQLEARRAGGHRLVQPLGRRGVALAREADVHREGVGGLARVRVRARVGVRVS